MLLVGVVFTALAVAVMVRDARRDSLTYDELGYIRSGYCTFETGVIDEDEPTNPPLFKLAAAAAMRTGPHLPADCSVVGDPLEPRDRPALESYAFRSRVPSMAVAVVVVAAAAALGWLAMRGPAAAWAAAASAAVMATEPNLLAHGHLATADVWLAAAVAVAVALDWAYLRWRWTPFLLAAGAATGVGLLTKATALALLPLLGLLHVVWWVRSRRLCRRDLLAAAGALVVAFAVVWSPYLFTAQAKEFRGEPMSSVRFGLPGAWVTGVEFQLDHARGGAINYLNGDLRPGAVLPLYYVEGIALKANLVLLVGAAVGAIVVVIRRRRTSPDAWVVLGAPAALFVAIPSAGAIHIGLRYALPAFPFLAALAGIGLSTMVASLARHAPAAGIAATAIATVAAVTPLRQPTIAYFNPLAGDRPERYLADSNLDWGQDMWRIQDWWTKAHRPPVLDLTFGPAPLGFYGLDVVPHESCPDARYAVVSESRRVMEPGIRVGRRVADITNAVSIYEPACP